MKRGEIWWADLPAPAGRRPVVLLSRDSAYAIRSSVTVAEISTLKRGVPTEVPLAKRDGMPRACVANADNLRTIPRAVLVRRIVAMRGEKLRALEDAVLFALGMEQRLEG